jgi:hypothetical protein
MASNRTPERSIALHPSAHVKALSWHLAPGLASTIHLLSLLLREPADSLVVAHLLRRALSDYESESC